MSSVLRKIAAAIFLTAVISPASAQLAPLKNIQQECSVRGCVRYSCYGTAVAVAHCNGGTVFLSAAHNLKSKSDTSKMVSLTVGGDEAVIKGQWYDDVATDLCLLFVEGRTEPLVRLADTPPEVGEELTAGGFDFAQVSGQASPGKPIARYYKAKAFRVARKEFGQTDRSWPVGMSGGSIVRPGGDLVGIIAHSSGFNVNYNYKDFVLSHYPDAVFAQAPPPPKNYKRTEPAAEPVIDKPAPPPKEIPARQDDVSKDAGKDAPPVHVKVPEIKDVPEPEPEQPEATQPGPAVDQLTIVDRVLADPRLLDAIRKRIGGEAAPLPPAGGSGWLGTAAGLAGTAAGGPLGGAVATGAASVAVWLYRRRRRRKQRNREQDRHRAEIKAAEQRGIESGDIRGVDLANRSPAGEDVTQGRREYPGGNRPPVPYPGATITNRYPEPTQPIAWQNVDNGFYATAHDEARRIVGKRYPGAQEILETELHLIQQFLSGQKPLSAPNRSERN